jgi:hypothetical protein
LPSVRLAVAVAAIAATIPALAVQAGATTSANLIQNPGAEAGAGSPDGSVVPVPAWKTHADAPFTAVQYGASGGFLTKTDPGPPGRGKNFFAGGPGNAVAVATQTDSLGPFAAAIDAGAAKYRLSGWLGGWDSQDDHAVVEVDFKDASGAVVGSTKLGPVTAAQRGDVTSLLQQKKSGAVPPGARKASVRVTFTRNEGSYDDGYVDNLSLTITTP